MVGVMVPLTVEGRRVNVDRRGSGGCVKHLMKKNSRQKLKTFQVAIQLEPDSGTPDLTRPQFLKRRSVQKICLPPASVQNVVLLAPTSVKKSCLPPTSVKKINIPPSERKTAVVDRPKVNRRKRSGTLDLVGVKGGLGGVRGGGLGAEGEKCRDNLSQISLGEGQGFTTFQEAALVSHNKYRDRHGVQHLQLDTKLCKVAQLYANKLAATNMFEHSGDSVYGENLYWGWSSDPAWVLGGEEAVDSWYDEKMGYDYSREPDDTESGHFTQLVWAGSSKLGVGLARSSKTGRYLVVMKYDPAGNFLGRYEQNVLRPRVGGGKQQI